MMLSTFRNRLIYLRTSLMFHGQRNLAFRCHDNEIDEELLPKEWYRVAYAKLVRLSSVLKDIEHIDGKLISVNDNSIINDVYSINQMQHFNSLARALIKAPFSQIVVKGYSRNRQPLVSTCLRSLRNSKPMTLDSLTKICDILGISVQQRKSIRLKVCQQVTQHHIWRGALEEILKDLKCEMDTIYFHSPTFQMAKQIVISCLKFLEDSANLEKSETPAWMRFGTLKKVENQQPPHKWEEVLEMFVHLCRCLGQEERLLCDIAKIEVLKDALYQVRDTVIERDISLKESRRQDSLFQKKLTESLGHSSKCLFTLLLYYLYGTIRNIKLEVCGGICGGGGKFYLQIGKILTSDDEKKVRNGIKQLYRALEVFKFVWDTASMNGTLELQGHLWSVGANERTLTYRGNEFFVHDIIL